MGRDRAAVDAAVCAADVPDAGLRIGIIGAGRAGTALARALARIPRLASATGGGPAAGGGPAHDADAGGAVAGQAAGLAAGLAAGVVVLMASTAPVPRLRRHLSIYAPEAHAVTVERIAVDTDVTVVAVPREDLDDVDVTHLSGERTRAVVDMTNSWEDNVLAPALARDGLSDSAALRRAWHEAGLEAPIVRAFFDVSHHVLADAGRAAVVAGPGGGSAAASEARQSLCVGADDADAGALIARLVTAMGFEARRCSLDEAKAHEPAAG